MTSVRSKRNHRRRLPPRENRSIKKPRRRSERSRRKKKSRRPRRRRRSLRPRRSTSSRRRFRWPTRPMRSRCLRWIKSFAKKSPRSANRFRRRNQRPLSSLRSSIRFILPRKRRELGLHRSCARRARGRGRGRRVQVGNLLGNFRAADGQSDDQHDGRNERRDVGDRAERDGDRHGAAFCNGLDERHRHRDDDCHDHGDDGRDERSDLSPDRDGDRHRNGDGDRNGHRNRNVHGDRHRHGNVHCNRTDNVRARHARPRPRSPNPPRPTTTRTESATHRTWRLCRVVRRALAFAGGLAILAAISTHSGIV